MTMKREYKKPVVSQIAVVQSHYLLGNNSVEDWGKSEKNDWGGDE